MSFRLGPDDARRGGLLIVGADASEGARLARLYADGGYETVAADVADDPATLAAGLDPPVFMLALPDAAVPAWTSTEISAVSVIGDERMSSLVDQAPTVPAILHLDPKAHAKLAGAFEAAQPDLPVHIHLDTIDGDRLLHLRTLRLFSSHAGVRGEM